MNINHPFFSHDEGRKCYPMYLGELQRYPKSNLTFITSDSWCLQFIRRLKGVCLYCERSSAHYDLGFCFQRHIWVLYSRKSILKRTMELARAVQLNGASRILVVPVNTQLTPKATYVRH